MSNRDSHSYYMILFVVLFGTFLFAIWIGSETQKNEAIKAGAAHFVIDQNGKKTFEYIKKEKEK